jgi:hypothetical protein
MSRLELEAEKTDGKVVAVHVGGTAVQIGSGELWLQPVQSAE